MTRVIADVVLMVTIWAALLLAAFFLIGPIGQFILCPAGEQRADNGECVKDNLRVDVERVRAPLGRFAQSSG